MFQLPLLQWRVCEYTFGKRKYEWKEHLIYEEKNMEKHIFYKTKKAYPFSLQYVYLAYQYLLSCDPMY